MTSFTRRFTERLVISERIIRQRISYCRRLRENLEVIRDRFLGVWGQLRFFRNAQSTVNGLFAYELGRTNTTTSTSTFQLAAGAYIGIRVWKRSIDGVETEITNGACVAVVNVLSSASAVERSGTWTAIQTSLEPSDCIVVRVYSCTSDGISGQTLLETFHTEQLGASQLNANLWTVYYWCRLYFIETDLFCGFYWGSTALNSRIEGFSYSPTPRRRIRANLSAITARFSWHPRRWIRRIRQDLSAIKDTFTSVYTHVVVPQVRSLRENLSSIGDRFLRAVDYERAFTEQIDVQDFLRSFIGFLRRLTQDLSTIQDIFRTVFTPLIIPVRRFTQDLSSLSDRIVRVVDYRRKFSEETIVQDAFRSIMSLVRRLTQDLSNISDVFSSVREYTRRLTEDLSTIKDSFVRAVSYLRQLPQVTYIEDVFKRFVEFPRKLTEDLSAIQDVFVLRLGFLRKLQEDLSVISHFLIRRVSFSRGTLQFVNMTQPRYMRGNIVDVNGLSAYELGASQSDVMQSVLISNYVGDVTATQILGIRVWKRSVIGEETEITSGFAVALAYGSLSGLISGTWNALSTVMAPTDSIVVRVYADPAPLAPTTLRATFTTEQLGSQKLDSLTWTVYYYLYREVVQNITYYYFRFGTTDYNSHIDNFGWSYTLRRFKQDLSSFGDVLVRRLGFLRLFTEDLSVIQDVFRFLLTPLIPAVMVYRFIQNIVVSDAFIRRIGLLRQWTEDLSAVQDAFVRQINYIRTLLEIMLIEDLLRRIGSFQRSLIEDLSAIQVILLRRIGFIRAQIEVVIVEVKAVLKKVKKWLAWLTKRMRLSLEKPTKQAEFKT